MYSSISPLPYVSTNSRGWEPQAGPLLDLGPVHRVAARDRRREQLTQAGNDGVRHGALSGVVSQR
jgi:hypothetical protein